MSLLLEIEVRQVRYHCVAHSPSKAQSTPKAGIVRRLGILIEALGLRRYQNSENPDGYLQAVLAAHVRPHLFSLEEKIGSRCAGSRIYSRPECGDSRISGRRTRAQQAQA